MRTTTYSKDGKIRCPYCNSIQVKRARNQPKKYPTPSFLAKAAKTPEFQFWQNGYDCKKCGNEFILESNPQPVTPPPSQPLPPTLTSPVVTGSPSTPKPKKKGGCLGLITKLIIIAAIALFAYGYLHNRGSSSHKTAKQDKSSSIEKSQNKNETLSITETHTVKNKD